MSITDELRKYIGGYFYLLPHSIVKSELATIADRIDAAHEEAMRTEYMRGKNDGYDENYASADDVNPKEPTVEDVLCEFAADFVGCANCVDDHEVTDAIELFAPKLRLAGDAE